MTVQIKIKSAAQCVEDFTLNCEFSNTISQVKDMITDSYPTKPERSQQKLIYAGKLLSDEATLESVLMTQEENVYVMHLVCPLPPEPAKDTKSNNTLPTVYSASSPFNSTNVFTQMNQPLMSSPDLTRMPMFSANSSDVTQQYMAMQQMYAQFMTQYFAQYNGNMSFANIPSVTPVQPTPNVAPQQNAAPNADRLQLDEVDWLDIIYDFLRGTLLVMLVGYYSSFTRMFGVALAVLLVTMIAKCLKNKQQADARQSAENNRASQPRPTETEREGNDASQSSSEENQNNENNASNGTQIPETVDTETRVQTPSSSPVPTIMSFVTAFFTSLIPSDPLPVNAN